MTVLPSNPLVPLHGAAHLKGEALGRMRALRVGLLILAVLLMSIMDLSLTLTYLRGPGMGEGNPIARWVMSANCGWALTAFKMGLVGITCIILWVARRRASGEVAAWACALILVWLTFQWKAYSDAMPGLTCVIPEMAEAGHPDWVKFEDR
ncbi:MAG: DUF5658 family protein [Phycisphaerales bacterium]